jgi:ATP-dependent Clp protease ATP-binding subunit ClpA
VGRPRRGAVAVMFERFNQTARQVVVNAQEEARRLRHNHIGSEHVLLGLLYEQDQIADRVLRSLGLTPELVRNQVVKIIAPGEEVTKVLELGLREALSLGHNTIGTEHLLLGLLRVSEGVGVRILLEHGLDPEQIRASVLELLPGPDPDPPRTSVRSIGRAQAGPAQRGMEFTVTPSEHADRVLMQACARALTEGRTEFNVMDVVFALRRDPGAAREMARVVQIFHNPLERGAAGDETDSTPEV